MMQQEVVAATSLVFPIFTGSVIQLSTHHLPSKYTDFALVYVIHRTGQKAIEVAAFIYMI